MFWKKRPVPKPPRDNEAIYAQVEAVMKERLGEREARVAAREHAVSVAFNEGARVVNVATLALRDAGQEGLADYLIAEADKLFKVAK